MTGNVLKSPVVCATEEELNLLHQQYDLTDRKKIRDDIMVLKDWMKKESHLVAASEYFCGNVIERLYFVGKGSVELTKARIDKYCTTRSLAPELCLNRNVDEFAFLRTKMQYLILPKLNPKDNTRIHITRYLTSDLDDIPLLLMLRWILMELDYSSCVDHHFGVRCIVDYSNFPMSYILKINPMLVKKIELLGAKAYGLKIKGIHMINVPSFLDKIMTIIKSSLSEKLAGRINVYSTYDDLYADISKDILPKEYGGNGATCAEISDQWKDALQSEDGKKIIQDIEKVTADETKRSSCKFNEEYLGMPGSFRTLSVD
ncbi:uncharacterized protein LOC121727808 [Aricia agestis]|uniref:uncharacterized protein LOC121727808 n=1 Tax=Aricia agestis TaxID=91739 RepID=UPI001C209137|nr:uncharacterized protein LOC121727808 [Aricia agestis]